MKSIPNNFNDLKIKQMDITAEKYYDDNLEKYNLLNKIDPMTAKQAMQMMEEYHQAKLKLLGIADVVGQSEQLIAKEQDAFDKGYTKGWTEGFNNGKINGD